MENFLIRSLKCINALPFPFSMKHYQVVGDRTSKMKDQELTSVESWDALRIDHPFFSISADREEWLAASELLVKKDGQDTRLIERAQDIVSLLRHERIERIFSVGAGGAALEYQIKKLMPEVSIVCSDYSKVTVERLRRVFTESDGVVEFDIIDGDWRKIQDAYLGPKSACMIYRIDASFSDKEWTHIFGCLAAASVSAVLVIPTGTLTLLSIYNRKKREIRWFFKKIPIVFSGYLRTKHRFREQWSRWYSDKEYSFGGLTGFLLHKEDGDAL